MIEQLAQMIQNSPAHCPDCKFHTDVYLYLTCDKHTEDLTAEEIVRVDEQARKNLREFFAEKEAEKAIDEARFSDSVYEI